MKKILTWLSATSIALLLSAPAAANSVIHIWSCKLNEGSTTEDVMTLTEDWLKAAKAMEGGADLRVLLEYPIAANAGNGAFTFVLIAPDFKTWGIFMDGYEESGAQEVDAAWFNVARCSSSGIWESTEVGTE